MFTEKQFIEVCEAHGILAPRTTLKEVFRELKSLKKVTVSDSRGQDLIAAYFDAFHKAHGYDPIVKPAERRLAKTVVETVGSLERAIELVRVYVRMPNQFFKVKQYDFMTFYQNLNPIQQRLETGRGTTLTQARVEEHQDANIEAVRGYIERTRGQAKE